MGRGRDRTLRGDPHTGSWRPLAPLPRSRLGGTAVVARAGATAAYGPSGARVFVAGHNNAPSRDANDRIDVYDPIRDVWSDLPCPAASALAKDGPGLAPRGRREVTSRWGVVADVVLYGDAIYAQLATRWNHPDAWSVGAVPRQAVLDLAALQWRAPLAMPEGSLTGNFPGTTSGLGCLLQPCFDGLWSYDGRTWAFVPWPDVGDGHPAATTLDDGRVLVIGRTRSWLVT